jgi:diacylglycerol O-acyltransferase / wax synthase
MGYFERLSALDASFLDVETRSSSMSVGAVLVLEGGPMVGAHGEIDIDRLRRWVGAAVSRVPRYRQRIERVPIIGQPVWVDDDHFVLDFHIRHTRLPWPGDDRQLDQLVGLLFSQRIDRDHPLWQLWVIEGLADNRFALVIKAHHCMVDGVAGVDLITQMLRVTPDVTDVEPAAWQARPRPGRLELIRAEVRHHNRQVARGLRGALRAINLGTAGRARQVAAGIANTLRAGIHPAPKIPLNPRHIGPHRRFERLRLDLARVKRVKTMLGGTVNDVVLATVTGALRRYLARRGIDVDRLGDLRALVPVNTRGDGDGGLGNQVALMLADLPVGEPDPRRRLERVCAAMQRLKTGSGQAQGSAFAERLADAVATGILSTTVRWAVRRRAFNLTITNVPGPQVPLWLGGSRLVGAYPKVPLYEAQAVGVALFSYDGGLYIGLSACWHAMPDLHDFRRDLEASFDELAALAARARPRIEVVRPEPAPARAGRQR